MDIDWSKAPEDATHYDPSDDGMNMPWVKLSKEGFYCWEDNIGWHGPLDYNDDFFCDGHVDRIIPRPTKPAAPEWDGEEFPVPIGVSCECTFAVEHHDTWHKGKVVFHGIDPEGRQYIVVDTGVYQACFRSVDYIRPLRTKAHRERDELEETLKRWHGCTVEVVAGVLIDNGWTKEKQDD